MNLAFDENTRCYVCDGANPRYLDSSGQVPICVRCHDVWLAPPRRSKQLEIDIPMPRITAPMAQRTCSGRFTGVAFGNAVWCGVHAKAAGIDNVPTCELHDCNDGVCRC